MALRWLIPLVVAAVGCGGGPKTVPVTGRVLLDGQPLSEAAVRFVGEGFDPPLTHPPNGTTDADGRYRLGYTGRADGAPPGRYRVTVMLQEKDETGVRSGRNLLPPRYEKPESSGLTATVNAGPTEVPTFELSSR